MKIHHLSVEFRETSAEAGARGNAALRHLHRFANRRQWKFSHHSPRRPYLAHDALTVPPVEDLNELEVVAREITAKRIDDLTALRQRLKVGVSPPPSI